MRSIDAHVVRTADATMAWYRLPPQLWSFRSDGQRESLIEAIGGQYAELQGRWLHLRVTTRPYDISTWARAHTRNAFGRPADVGGALSFDDYMIGEQRQLIGASMAEKEVYLGIEVRARTSADRIMERLAPLVATVAPRAVDAELVGVHDALVHLDHLVSGTGLEGRPVTAEEMRWLLQRSCTLGLSAPEGLPPAGDGRWEASDLAVFDDAASWYAEPYAPTVTVTGRSGQVAGQTRHVAVLSVGLVGALAIPEVHDPWMQPSDGIAAAVEWSARIYVRRPEEVTGELQRQASKVRSQTRHYTEEHDQDAPQSLARQADRVHEIDDAVTSGLGALATRVKSWWRVAVAGETEREALHFAQQLVERYKKNGIALEHPEAQHAMAREFIPGEPLASVAYCRRASVRWAASAVPTATAEVGDRRGILLGETATATRRPVAWDPWMAQEVRDSSGLTAIAAGLGGGKSFLGGGIVYKTLRAGARWTILDPSGPLAKLCELPEITPWARQINLLNAQPGILNPYRVVAEPQPEHYLSAAEQRLYHHQITRFTALGQQEKIGGLLDEARSRQYARDKVQAAASRRRLTLDVLTGLLPCEIAVQAETTIVLLAAVRAVGGAPSAHPGMVIDQLRRDAAEPTHSAHPAHAAVVADFLDEIRERLTLLIPEPGADPYAELGERDWRLTVFTLAGLTLPKDGTPRSEWTEPEALGVELLNLAAWLTQRIVYEQPKHERKGVWIDEAFFLSEVPTGRVLMNRFARDSRKWNVRVLLSSQLPADFLRINGVVSLLDSVFIGRLDDENAQADALRLLKVPVGIGYEAVLGQLGKAQKRGSTTRDFAPRQFIFADGAGGVERFRVNYSGPHLDHVRDALDTTPTHPASEGYQERDADDHDVDPQHEGAA